jgi:Trypsin-like peptidase domain
MPIRIGCTLILILLLSAPSRAETTCIDPALLTHSTVGVARYFDQTERGLQQDLLGIRGTAWFQSPKTLITAAHVVSAMKLSTDEWKELVIEDGTDSQSIPVRIQRLADNLDEKLALLELQTPMSNARSVAIRMSPLLPDDRVVTFAYPDRLPRIVTGRFVQYVDDGRLAGSALLEIYDGDNRLVIDHGASGSPVFDCDGRVAAVISTVIMQALSTPFGAMRIPTGWGLPNVVSVPVQQLTELPKVQ